MSEPTTGGLRERLAEALRTTPSTGNTHEPGQERFDHHPKPGERGHSYTYTCALCRNDVDALADALLPVVEQHVAGVRAAGLGKPERTMLGFALDLAQEAVFSRGDEFSDEDQAAIDSLRRMAADDTTEAS